MSTWMFWRSSKGLLAVVPTTAIISYLLLMHISKEDSGPVVRMDSGGKQLSSHQGAVEERELAAALKNPSRGPRIQNGRESWSIGGSVRDQKGEALPLVKVSVGVDKAGLHRHIARTQTDPRGSWSLSLNDLKLYSAAFRNGSRLQVHFEARDHPHLDRYLELPALSSRSYSPRLSVEMGRGCKISGRVLDRRYRPIKGASLYLSGPEQREEYFARSARAKTDSFGRFEVFVRVGGQHVLEAFKPGVGSSKRQAIRVGRQKTIRTPDLFLGSGEQVDGRVQYEDGSPVTSALLLAQISPVPAGRPARAHADRIEELNFWTDDTGRFHLGGLQPGQYAVGDRIDTLDGFATLLNTKDSDAKVIVHRQRLQIRIRDREGWILPGTKIHVSVWTGKNATIARNLNRETGDLDSLLNQASRREFIRLARESGDLDLWLERGSYCLIRLAIPGCLPIARGILLDPGSNEEQIRIVLQNR